MVKDFLHQQVQFPVSLCFAMTINKSQGKMFKAVGVDKTDESFTHEMLYVALCRVGSPDCLSLLVRKDYKTLNFMHSKKIFLVSLQPICCYCCCRHCGSVHVEVAEKCHGKQCIKHDVILRSVSFFLFLSFIVGCVEQFYRYRLNHFIA